MARCGCAQVCSCVVQGSDCATVSGDGSVGTPYTVTPKVSVEPCNLLRCRLDAEGNPGLFAEEDVQTLNGSCVELLGNGSCADPLTSELIVSPDGGNALECRANGAFVPAVAVGVMCRATIERTIQDQIPASAGACNTVVRYLAYDSQVEDNCGFVQIGGGGELILVVPVGLDGYYLLTMEDRDSSLAENTDEVTVGIQIRVNGVVVASQRFERAVETQKILNCSRQILLAAGDVVSGYWQIHRDNGATVPHTLAAGGTGLPTFLQLVRLSDA